MLTKAIRTARSKEPPSPVEILIISLCGCSSSGPHENDRIALAMSHDETPNEKSFLKSGAGGTAEFR